MTNDSFISYSTLAGKLTKPIKEKEITLSIDAVAQVLEILHPEPTSPINYSQDQLPYVGYLIAYITGERETHFKTSAIDDNLVKRILDFSSNTANIIERIAIFKEITGDYKGSINDYEKGFEYATKLQGEPRSQAVFKDLKLSWNYADEDAIEAAMKIVKADRSLETYNSIKVYIKDFADGNNFTFIVLEFAKSRDNYAAREYVNLRKLEFTHNDALKLAKKYLISS